MEDDGLNPDCSKNILLQIDDYYAVDMRGSSAAMHTKVLLNTVTNCLCHINLSQNRPAYVQYRTTVSLSQSLSSSCE